MYNYSCKNLQLEFSDNTIGCKIKNINTRSVYNLQFYADRFCPKFENIADKDKAVNNIINFIGYNEQDNILTAKWKVLDGEINCQIKFENNANIFTWKIDSENYHFSLSDKYILAGISWNGTIFTHQIDPCRFEGVAAYWPNKISDNQLCFDISGVRIGNNYIINYNNSEAVLTGSLDFAGSSQHNISRNSSSVTICHYNTIPENISQEGVFIACNTWERCALVYCDLLEARGVFRKRKPVQWHTEAQWCDWVPYRWDTCEEKILKNAEEIRISGIDVGTIVIDAGWFDYLGDWDDDRKKFPSGMKELIARLHKMDFKVVLWFCPHIIHPASKAVDRCKDFLVRNTNGSLYRSEREGKENVLGYFIDPTSKHGIKFIKDMTNKLLKEFDADGLKIDYIYLHPTRTFVTEVPLEENEYVYKIHEIISNEAKKIKQDCLVSIFSYSAHLAELGDDIRTGDTFNGCNYRTLGISQIKTKVAAYQHPYVLLLNDYIGSYDLPIEKDVFHEWLTWIKNMPRSVVAYGWQPWDKNLNI